MERSNKTRYLLDTHAWIWWHSNSKKLSKKVFGIINSKPQEREILLSAISIWEFCKLLEKGHLRLAIDGDKWIEEALKNLPLQLVPLSPEICWQSTTLPGNIHGDPADQLIAATARNQNATLLTKDKLLAGYEHVRSLW